MDYIYLIWSNGYDGADVICTTFDEEVANGILDKLNNTMYYVSRIPILSSVDDYKPLIEYYVRINKNGVEEKRHSFEQKSLLNHHESSINVFGGANGWSTQSFEHAKELAMQKLKSEK